MIVLIKSAGIHMNRKGFTLVEMAVVLVIIGIILGMVVKGRELVQGAKTKSFIVDVKNLENMQYTFYDRFGRFAGDCDNDGLVDEKELNLAQTSLDGTPTGLCTAGTAQDDPDAAFSELKAVDMLSDESNSAHSTMKGGFGFAYFAQDAEGKNVIVLRNVPCYAAVSLDTAIDKTLDGTKGKIKAGTAGNSVWTADGMCEANLTDGTVGTVLYYYDR